MGAPAGEQSDPSSVEETAGTAQTAATDGASAVDTERLREHIQEALTALETLDATL